MLSTSLRHLARVTRHTLPGTAIRTSTSVSLDKPLPTSIADLKRFEPAEWFSDITDPSIRAEITKIRDIESELIAAVSRETVDVDWDSWAKEIKSPGLVEELKTIQEEIPLPDVEKEQARLHKVIEETFEPVLKQFSELAKESEEEAIALEKRLEEVTFLRDNLKELTVDEFLERYPTVKANIENDIANNKWYVQE